MVFQKKRYKKIFIILGVFFFLPIFLFSQQSKKSRILFLLDASSSMTYQWNQSSNRFEVASHILLRVVDSIYALNPEVEFALRTYGTMYPAIDKNCTDTRLEVPFNIQNVNQIYTRLKSLDPIGYSPIAYSLKQAADNELNDANQYDYSIIFITDGGESCNGNVCETFKNFLQKKIKVVPYIIGLDKNEQLNLLYDCMGNYIKVANNEDIDLAIKTIIDANRPLVDKPKTMNIKPVFSKVPEIKKDTIKNVVPIPNKKNILVRLMASIYHPYLNLPFLLNATKLNWSIGVALLRFALEEEKKIIPMVRQNETFPKLKNIAYKKAFTTSVEVKGISSKIKNTNPAILKFDYETPVQKITHVFPKLKNLAYHSKASEIKISAKTKSIPKNQMASLRFDFAEPIQRNHDFFKRLIARKYSFSQQSIAFENPKLKPFKNNQIATLHFELEEKKKLSLTSIYPKGYPKRIAYAIRIPQAKPMQKNNTVAILRFDLQPTPPKPPIAPVQKTKDTIATKPKIQDNTSEYTVLTENNDKTEVIVFFQDRNGKRYPNATPEIIFKDLNAQGATTSFIRKVNGGEPVPHTIKAGKYDAVVKGYNDLFVKNVTIEENKLNKVIIKVTDGTLSFAYMGNRTRPMEYKAVVNRRFSNAPDILQSCTQKLPYEPGTYYVEINTLPPSKFSIDMSFGALYELQIQEPGFLQISNNSPYGTIHIQYEHGDKFETFYNMKISGNVASQKIEMLPGRYKVIFPTNPQMPQMGTKIIDFKIFSNQTTEVELK